MSYEQEITDVMKECSGARGFLRFNVGVCSCFASVDRSGS